MKNLSRVYNRTNNTLAYAIPQRLFSLPKISYSINLKFFIILSAIFIILFLAFYIFQIGTVISSGYKIQSYENKIEQISGENKILEINSAKINSLANIDSKIQTLGFEKIDRIHYIQILENSMVTVNNSRQ